MEWYWWVFIIYYVAVTLWVIWYDSEESHITVEDFLFIIGSAWHGVPQAFIFSKIDPKYSEKILIKRRR